MPFIRVIAAAIIRDGRLLLVSKRAAPEVFYLPGGKPDPGESDEECVRRELREELGVGAVDLCALTEVRSRAALEPARLHMSVYRARLDDEPRAAAEIASLLWWPDRAHAQLAPAVRYHVLPMLRARGILPDTVADTS